MKSKSLLTNEGFIPAGEAFNRQGQQIISKVRNALKDSTHGTEQGPATWDLWVRPGQEPIFANEVLGSEPHLLICTLSMAGLTLPCIVLVAERSGLQSLRCL